MCVKSKVGSVPINFFKKHFAETRGIRQYFKNTSREHVSTNARKWRVGKVQTAPGRQGRAQQEGYWMMQHLLTFFDFL